jgi:hypothetical protein
MKYVICSVIFVAAAMVGFAQPLAYSKDENWLAKPGKTSFADSISKPLVGKFLKDTSVDVFFIYPTIYTDKDKPNGWFASVTDDAFIQKIQGSTLLFQASAFNQYQLYIPLYRQVHLSAYFINDRALQIRLFDTAYADVRAAFEYYLQHFNRNKPFIIASHSQGATHAKRLLKELIDTTLLKNRLVAAYLIGMDVPVDLCKNLPPCAEPASTGCIISWRTYKEGFTPENILRETKPMIVTNPLTWSASVPSITRESNPGSILRNFNKLVPKVASATVAGNVLHTVKPHFKGSIFLRTKNYHIADINFYYLSIKQNVQQRVSAFWKR